MYIKSSSTLPQYYVRVFRPANPAVVVLELGAPFGGVGGEIPRRNGTSGIPIEPGRPTKMAAEFFAGRRLVLGKRHYAPEIQQIPTDHRPKWTGNRIPNQRNGRQKGVCVPAAFLTSKKTSVSVVGAPWNSEPPRDFYN